MVIELSGVQFGLKKMFYVLFIVYLKNIVSMCIFQVP